MSDTETFEAGDQPQGLLDDWLNRRELAEELGVSVDTLARWETQRRGPVCVRVGRRVLYRRGAVRDWLLGQEKPRVRAGARA